MENLLTLDRISEVKTEKARQDGKVSRKYYTAYFSDPSTPFAQARQRNFFQSHNADGSEASWKIGAPEKTMNFIGKNIPAEVVTRKVTPYELNGKMVDSFTTVVLKGESVESAFKQQGHPLATSTSVEAEAEALN